MNGSPAEGVQHLFRGFRLLRSPGVLPFVAIPFLINLIVFSGLIWFAAAQFAGLLEWVNAQLGEWSAWLAWLAWLLWLLFALVSLLVVFYGFTLVANLIGAPFNGLLAERIARNLGIPAPAVERKSLPRQMLDDSRQEFRKLAYFLLWAAGLAVLSLVLFWIPLANALIPLIWFAFGAWMMALEYSDYHLANTGMKFVEERRLLRRHRWPALGFGAAAALATLVPLVNFLVMPAAVAGAVSLWRDRLPENPGATLRD